MKDRVCQGSYVLSKMLLGTRMDFSVNDSVRKNCEELVASVVTCTCYSKILRDLHSVFVHVIVCRAAV